MTVIPTFRVADIIKQHIEAQRGREKFFGKKKRRQLYRFFFFSQGLKQRFGKPSFHVDNSEHERKFFFPAGADRKLGHARSYLDRWLHDVQNRRSANRSIWTPVDLIFGRPRVLNRVARFAIIQA